MHEAMKGRAPTVTSPPALRRTPDLATCPGPDPAALSASLRNTLPRANNFETRVPRQVRRTICRPSGKRGLVVEIDRRTMRRPAARDCVDVGGLSCPRVPRLTRGARAAGGPATRSLRGRRARRSQSVASILAAGCPHTVANGASAARIRRHYAHRLVHGSARRHGFRARRPQWVRA
jgi:hypothetical protein